MYDAIISLNVGAGYRDLIDCALGSLVRAIREQAAAAAVAGIALCASVGAKVLSSAVAGSSSMSIGFDGAGGGGTCPS